VGTRTNSRVADAHAQVLTARAEVADQVDRLEAAGRAAVDIPAKVKASPGKAAGIAAGGAFLAVGGPKKLFRRAKRAITGKDEELPSELLPKDVEKAIRKLGTDGRKVRGTLEREFANYLDERAKERKKEGLGNAVAAIALAAVRPVALRTGKQLAERMLDPNQAGFNDQLAKVRARRAAGGTTAKPEGAPEDAGL
jgi:hypothetical protein